MKLEIFNQDFSLVLHGLSGEAAHNNYSETGFGLMNAMWEKVKSKGLKHKGINTWVYEPGHKMFTGVELEDNLADTGLELKKITLSRYAYYKYTGPYNRLPELGRKIKWELDCRGLQISFPYIEIYGHWTEDESKLETEIIVAVE